MKLIKLCLLYGVLLIPVLASAQAKQPAPKMNDLFMNYMARELRLQPAELSKMRPIVRNYLIARRKAIKTYSDPLEKEAQIVRIKKNFRSRYAKVIGLKRANSFFTYEQQFRRKVREELRERNRRPQKN